MSQNSNEKEIKQYDCEISSGKRITASSNINETRINIEQNTSQNSAKIETEQFNCETKVDIESPEEISSEKNIAKYETSHLENVEIAVQSDSRESKDLDEKMKNNSSLFRIWFGLLTALITSLAARLEKINFPRISQNLSLSLNENIKNERLSFDNDLRKSESDMRKSDSKNVVSDMRKSESDMRKSDSKNVVSESATPDPSFPPKAENKEKKFPCWKLQHLN